MDTTTIEIPTELLTAAKLTPDQATTELVIRLLQQERISPEQARTLAGERSDEVERLLWRRDKKFDLDTFLDWASHDFKTPLNAVIGFTKVVLKGIDGPVNETQITDLTTAHTGGQRMLSLTSMLVDIARLNSGKVELSPSEGNITELIQETAARWRTQNPNKTLHVDASLQAPVIRFDNPRMRQALAYFLNYAALHIADGGQVSLSAADDEGGVNFTVQSSGERPREKNEMDKAMLAYIGEALIELHSGSLTMMHVNESSALILFSIPR